jgi:hypothetical protein
VQAWVNQHDIEDVAPEMLASLPSLAKGDSWWWSPGALGIFQHTRARERETFDSSRTPKVGERIRPPKVLAPVDLERLRTSMAETIEKAKADDPKTLRAEIARLKVELQRAQKPGAAVVDQAAIDRAVRDALVKVTAEYDRRVTEAKRSITDAVKRAQESVAELGPDIASTLNGLMARVDAPLLIERRPIASPSHVSAPRRPVAPPASRGTVTTPGIGKGERSVLIAIAQSEGGVARDTLTVLTGYKRSSRDTYIQRLAAPASWPSTVR